ncbi:alpha/beta hydrolase [Saccharopolyspora elongata]|uniref:Alpha/beta hydrolase n=1 Tax=Saccharopolyspora elongata TaxID=2530387 RepID=A0A4R4YBN4_9PSEU|nr:alpha/beta hydrolase [Saccharopolyspora elongata]TDD41264.1 alpha/beta hydrolase [Saccharopolyspora elongata]
MTTPLLKTLDVDGNAISYDEHGERTDPTVVLLTGWCQDHRLFDPLVPHLTADHHVVRIDWRGHGADRRPVADFGPAEQASDAIAVLDSLGVDRFLPVSTSHGGWANIELADRVGATRVPSLIVIDWIMTPASPEFVASLKASGDPDGWRQDRQDLFDIWLNDSSNELVRNHLDNEMAAFDHEMWDRSCRVIAEAYETWGSPLPRMAAMRENRPIKHLFSQPTDPSYEAAQAHFHEEHPWFSHRNLRGETHFPTLDSPQLVADEIRARATGR